MLGRRRRERNFMDSRKTIWELSKEMNVAPEVIRVRKSQRIRSFVNSFSLGLNRLQIALAPENLFPGAVTSKDGEKIYAAQLEIARHFFNFTILARSIIDQLSNLHDELFGETNLAELSLEKLRKDFEATIDEQLITGIRELSAHRSAPIPKVQGGVFVFSSRDLLEWSWSGPNMLRLVLLFLSFQYFHCKE